MTVARNARLWIAAALCAVAVPAIAQEGDRLAGVWQLNVAKSKYEGAAPPKSQTTTLHALDGGLHEIVERVNADGSTTRWEVTARYDGRDYPVAGDPSRDTVAMTRVDRNTVDIVNKKAGVVVSRMRIVVAEDGRTRTNTVMDPSGKKTVAVLFFERR
ncbi:MAG TPA: hypothetical protein VNI78_01850 [Vicinamibacterales bacterium]|nr:hypothetical protein [Vicinamibacterales bacterium]